MAYFYTKVVGFSEQLIAAAKILYRWRGLLDMQWKMLGKRRNMLDRAWSMFMPDGIYTTTLEKTGYKKVIVTVSVANGEMTVLNVQLEKN